MEGYRKLKKRMQQPENFFKKIHESQSLLYFIEEMEYNKENHSSNWSTKYKQTSIAAYFFWNGGIKYGKESLP